MTYLHPLDHEARALWHLELLGCFEPGDAVVIRIEAETITVAGLELASSEGRVVESGQVWRCALVRE